jgi:hypothetical protein
VNPAALFRDTLICAAERAMNTVIFQNADGASIASLVLSNPVAPERHCIFINMCFTSAVFESRESQVLLPDRPTEYACRYLAAEQGCEISFENQNGWRIEVMLDDDAEGEWAAEKDGERVEGFAFALPAACPL